MHKEKHEEIESKAMQKKENKEMIQMRSGLFELKKELKKHEGKPMDKAHPKTK